MRSAKCLCDVFIFLVGLVLLLTGWLPLEMTLPQRSPEEKYFSQEVVS